MSGQIPPAPRRNSLVQKRNQSTVKKSSIQSENGATNGGTLSKPSSPKQTPVGGERTVKKLRLSKALTIPEGTTVSDACRRMAARRVDAVLLTDANALLSGIVTDKDIATRVIAEELRPEQTIISKVMTRNPIFVNSDSLAIEALQKMVQGKFRHLPVVENGEVIALLDITKCLYDAISRMEKAAEQGSAIAAAVEGVERQWGSNFSAPSAFIETLRDRMFKPCLSTIIAENAKVAIVSPSDPVHVAAKQMRELRVNSVVIATENKIQGILTSRDILMRVVAQNLSPMLTLVEKVMTPNPECATLETTILEALHIMHDGKFLHLPIVDKDGYVVACVDVLQITHAAISMVDSSSGAVNDVANTMMQKFWDSALSLEPPEDYDNQSEMSMSAVNTSDGTELGRYPSLGLGNSFAFKFADHKGRVHRLNFGTENLGELVSAVMQRFGDVSDQGRPQLLYEDDEGDRVLLTTDGDLVSAVSHARSVGLKVLRLHLDVSDSSQQKAGQELCTTTTSEKTGWLTPRSGILAGAVALTGISVMVYLKRNDL
ncbi:CBS domain-containing protein CBSCBSPB3 [Camellia lanceoleosa]|uniref:CBS domain-containing protein CBSCBSPB3 n=1 Tax=Camellia lanceoleosa TaxID=1840588 RepID=A0ACC0IVM3_9ERIC|nr:CBS domain-containing protein CBSCBSPB3 [Camellia lanceoleosa]